MINYEKVSFDYDTDEIKKICKLYKSDVPLISKVSLDNIVEKASESFDFKFTGENKFYPFLFPEILKTLDFQILVITGASGAGKSIFSKYFGEEENIEWDLSKSIISNFESVDDGVDKLSATGLSSIPSWCKPYNVLSVGEKFRADLARRLKSNCIVDEFTSTVNRETAMSCSVSISKYIRKHNLNKCVFVSCHKDFIDALCPDYVIDLDDECLYDTRRLLRRKYKLHIYETEFKTEMWQIFKRHHYLSSEINVACRMFVAYLNTIPVACCAVLPQPGVVNLVGGTAYRIHRLVVLPDFQGLGIGVKLLEYVADMYKYHGKIMYIKTSHKKLINYMMKSNKWKCDGKMIGSDKTMGSGKTAKIVGKKFDKIRFATSSKYIAECENNPNYNYEAISFPVHIEENNDKIKCELF